MFTSGKSGGTVPQNVPGGRKGHSEAIRCAAAGRHSLWRADSGPQSQAAVGFCSWRKVPGKIHPSRELAGGAADTRAGDRDGPDALPDSAGSGG